MAEAAEITEADLSAGAGDESTDEGAETSSPDWAGETTTPSWIITKSSHDELASSWSRSEASVPATEAASSSADGAGVTAAFAAMEV
jgi:hypothetical protein